MILYGSAVYGRLRKVQRDNQIQLAGPLRWQILGHVLLGIGWSVMLVADVLPVHDEAAQISVFAFFFTIGLGAVVYGKHRERVALTP
jgi:uncharacterized membrane protein